MGFFSRKPKKNKTPSNAAETASEDKPSTPRTKEVPTTPETVKGVESPDPVAPNPSSMSAGNESHLAEAQEPKVQDDDKPAAARAKKKHRTRISVTTPEKTDEDGSAWDPNGETPDVDPPSSAVDLDERNISDDNSQIDLDRSVESAADETGVDSTFLDDDEQNFRTSRDDESSPKQETVNKNLLSNFEGCDILPDSLKAMLPESWRQTEQTTTEAEGTTLVEEPAKKLSYYSDEFATSFLQELLKNGFALVYHQPSLTIEEEKADWQGRSVTMNFKAGVCNALEIFQPEIEWSTMGGGKDKKILTRSVSLLDIHSIAVSSTDDMRDNLDAGESEEIKCFFTMTTKSGDIHVFEAMNIDESNRLVLGIKNISGRYSNLIVAGDPRVMVEFFDNSSDPQEIRLPFERAIVQVSHAFLG